MSSTLKTLRFLFNDPYKYWMVTLPANFEIIEECKDSTEVPTSLTSSSPGLRIIVWQAFLNWGYSGYYGNDVKLSVTNARFSCSDESGRNVITVEADVEVNGKYPVGNLQFRIFFADSKQFINFLKE